ncbi:MAG TPA: prolipoprotein diacylglyceryl transferase family protein [Gaiellaceae bacterium]|nr:prolipoprotein diacylglyceryl transferase family protein [Gaiellaceae bacterium]
MRPTLVVLRGIRVPSYQAMFCLGVTLGVVAQNAAANAAGLSAPRVYAATFVLLPIGIAGTRVLYVLGHRHEFRGNPRQIVHRASGGMALYGGLLAIVPASVPVLAALDVPFWRYWDVTIFLLLAAMVCTRIGCLLNGCCAGRLRRAPTQLLEAAVGAVLFVAALVLWPVLDRPGALFLVTVAGYGAARTVLQPLRAEGARIDAMVLISLALVVSSSAALAAIGT